MMLLLSLLLSFSIHIHANQVRQENSSLPPFVFLPGFAASWLFATITDSKYLPASCEGSGLPINQPLPVDVNETLRKSFPMCAFDILSLEYNESSYEYSQPAGIEVKTAALGSFAGVAPNYWVFATKIASLGYVEEKNLFAAPYDYRVMSSGSYERNGFIAALKQLIEKAYETNANKKVIIAGHSNGGPALYSFLVSSEVSQEWKEKYLAAAITLSGNMLGQMNMIYEAVAPASDNTDMQWSWEGNYGSLPWGEYAAVSDFPIVTTYYNTTQEKNYTSKLADLVDLFTHLNKPDWAARMQGMYAMDTMNRTAHPLVDCYCLFGSNLSTGYSFIFQADAQQDQPIQVREMDGDNNQDIMDNTLCNVWAEDSRAISKKYHFESQAFPNVGHMDMISDDKVISKIKDIVALYSV